ncbi:MAG: hypothetical protein KC550_06240, partial [Nanoarchaeota archaeon]|nr:hypothetical protein [Nanoarchaeota archaeon]
LINNKKYACSYLILFFFFILLIFFSACSNEKKLIEETEIIENKNVEDKILENEKIVLEPKAENFLKILSTNLDGKEYLEKYPNTKVKNFKLINPDEFLSLKNETRFKELYVDLPEKELYYVEFEGNPNLNLMTIIDLDEQKVEKIFGKMIMGLG